jgi:hypothetical protein
LQQAIATAQSLPLPALIDRAVAMLANAKTAAEVLEAKEIASFTYDIAKKTARLEKAKDAASTVVKAALNAQADALYIEAQAKRRLADEYDRAQERGEVQPHGGQGKRDVPNENIPSTSELGISRKVIHEGRELRDAEEADPGIVRRVLDEALDAGEEPTRAKVKRAVKAKSRRKRHPRRDLNSPADSQHDRDLRALLGIWEAACPSAREAFLNTVTE